MRRLQARPCSPWLLLAVLLPLQSCDTPPTDIKADTENPQALTAAPEFLDAASTEDADLDETVHRTPFSDAQLFFEFNATDNDLGLQLFLDSEGWKRIRVIDPSRRDMFLVETAGRLAKSGVTELRFEGVEPSPEEILALFPAGQYRFRGRSVDGQALGSNVTLSHDLPPAPTFSVSGGKVVERNAAVVEWSAPGADKVEVIVESDALDHTLDITLSSATHRLRLPPQFLTPGQEYKIELLSIGANGNRTLTESTFRVARHA